MAATAACASAGRDVSRMPVEARVRAGMSLVPEKRELFASLPVEDNLRLGGFRFRHEGAAATRRHLDEVFDLFPRLRERRRQLAGTLSGGERQMLAMGRALMSRPDLLMLDEPSLGLAPLIVREIFTIIADLRARSCAVLLVEQNARAALQVAITAMCWRMAASRWRGRARSWRRIAGWWRPISASLGQFRRRHDARRRRAVQRRIARRTPPPSSAPRGARRR